MGGTGGIWAGERAKSTGLWVSGVGRIRNVLKLQSYLSLKADSSSSFTKNRYGGVLMHGTHAGEVKRGYAFHKGEVRE